MRRRNNREPPKVMTWAKASRVLAVAAVCDVLRYMFLFFWFFGPALVGLYCTTKVGDVALIGDLLTKGCIAGATAIGIGGFAVAATFGTVMAISVGFLGWLIVTFIIFATDRRTFGENPFTILWLFEGIGASVFIMAWGIYRTQIKIEKAALKKYQAEQVAAQQQERNQQIAQAMQMQAAQQAQAANDEQYAAEEQEAANDENYGIPDEVRKRA